MLTFSTHLIHRARNRRTAQLAGLVLALFASLEVNAGTITVGGSGASAPTLSVGVSMASDGDSVLVHAGTYYEIVNTSKSLILVAEGGAGSVILDGGSFATVLKFQDVSGDVTVSGFEIRNGSSTRGGGLVLDNVTGTSTLIDCTFSGNIATTSGGAVDCVNSTAIFSGCGFAQNWVAGPHEIRGGAVSGRSGSSLSFSACVFQDNVAGYGGAIYASGALPSVLSSSFTNNVGTRGGAIYSASATSVLINACNFEGCSSNEFGGAVFLTGDDAQVQGSTFHANICAGGMGGAIYCAGGSGIEIGSSLFNANSAQNGGGLAGAPSLASVHNNTFYGNSATDQGAHLFCNGSSPAVERNIFALASVGAAVAGTSPAAPTFGCNDFWSNADGDIDGLADPMGLQGNFSEDPLFCDAANDDFGLDVTSICYFGNEPSECGGIGSSDVGAFSGTCGESRVEASTWGAIKARYK